MIRTACMLVFACVTATSAVAEVIVDQTVPSKAWTYSKEAATTASGPEKEPAHPCAGKSSCNLPCRLVVHPNYHGKSWEISIKPCLECAPHTVIPVPAGVSAKWVCGSPGQLACINWYTNAGEKKRTWWHFEGTRAVAAAPPPPRRPYYASVRPRHHISHVESRSCTKCDSPFHRRFRKHFTCCSSRSPATRSQGDAYSRAALSIFIISSDWTTCKIYAYFVPDVPATSRWRTRTMRTLIASLFALCLALTAVAAQEGKKIEPGCQPDQLPGCATICLSKGQHKRIVENRAKRDQEPKWRPSICDGTDYGSGSCEYARWSGRMTRSSACSTSHRFVSDLQQVAMERWGNGYACSIK